MEELAQRLQDALGSGYEVGDRLGAGGFAVVYRVRDLGLKRNLAVKVLSPDLITSHSVLERFRREAETVARLSHPNIVPLHFIGQKDDLLYLVMTCVEGGSVADRLQRDGQLPIADACRIMSEVASALAHAHEHGVVHRDIKPQNVLVERENGRCLVTDFGIARTADGGALTATGMFVGTPDYLSPEQLSGEGSDERSDTFALGVMSYVMLAGQTPFSGATPTAALRNRLSSPPEPLGKVRSDVPRWLERIVVRCLAQDPAERFQKAEDVFQAIAAGPTAERDVAWWRSRRARIALGAGSGAALLVAIVIALQPRSELNEPDVNREPSTPVVDTSMILVPARSYRIGDDSGPAHARPSHLAAIAAFGIGRQEVRAGDYAAYAGATGAALPWREASPPDRARPATGVQWSEAQAFCAWRYPAGGRLPTEQEWEAAAQSQPPDELRDMVGSVWEWTSSAMRAYPGARALPDSMAQFRVIRGGASNTPESLATIWVRGYARPDSPRQALQYTGFRCAMSPGSVAPSR